MSGFWKFIKRAALAAAAHVFGLIVALLLVPLLILLIGLAFGLSQVPEIQPKSVLAVDLSGEIVDALHPRDWILEEPGVRQRLSKILKALKWARTDKRVSGVAIKVDAPSIAWASVSALRRELEEVKKSGKFVYVHADRLNEKLLYLSSVATRLSLHPYGDVEFDGLAMEEPYLKGLLKKLDVEPVVFRAGKYKAAVEPLILDHMSAANREQIGTLLGDFWNVLRDALAIKTGHSKAEVDGWASGLKLATAEDLKNQKIVDAVGFEDEFEEAVRIKSLGEDSDDTVRWVTVDDVLHVRAREATLHMGRHKSSTKKIAVFVIDGEITKGFGDGRSVGDADVMSSLDEVKDDESVAAIVLRIDSPGGDALASDIMWRAFSELDDEIPVVASMGDVAASGGYYVASSARYIFSEALTLTGSIGVFGVLFNAENLLHSKLAVNMDRVATHPHADFGGPFRALMPAESQHIQTAVERTYRRFLEVVAQSRGFDKIEQVAAIAEGRVWAGERAQKLKLVDEIGGYDRAIAKAAEFAKLGSDYEVVFYPKSQDPISRILERLGENMSLVSWARAPLVWLARSNLMMKWFGARAAVPTPEGAFAAFLDRMTSNGSTRVDQWRDRAFLGQVLNCGAQCPVFARMPWRLSVR